MMITSFDFQSWFRCVFHSDRTFRPERGVSHGPDGYARPGDGPQKSSWETLGPLLESLVPGAILTGAIFPSAAPSGLGFATGRGFGVLSQPARDITINTS